jgi:hypothetical protein
MHLPTALAGIDLGEHVLEIGPRFGASTRVLVDRVPKLAALEIGEAPGSPRWRCSCRTGALSRSRPARPGRPSS